MNAPDDLRRTLVHNVVIPAPDRASLPRKGVQRLIDPWYDYLAFPVAPLVLVAQVAGLLLRAFALRLIVLVVGPLLIGAMLAYVSSLPLRADQGVNIGEGLLVLCFVASLTLTFAAALIEGVRAIRAERRRRRM